MQVFWSIVAFLTLIVITYKFGYSNGKDSVEISDDKLKDDIEFLSAFAMYLNIESMRASKKLPDDLEDSKAYNKALLAYTLKMAQFKREWSKKSNKKE